MENNSKASYKDTFLQKTDFTARNGKTAYVRPEHHKKLTQIVQIIGDNKISMSELLDKILGHHFSEFQEQIKEEFQENYKSIF